MSNLQKIGGASALIGAITNILAIGVFLIFLAPKGYGSEDLNPNQIVAFLTENQAIMRIWYQIIFLAFGVCLIFLSLALYEHLKTVAPTMALVVTMFGMIWAVMVIAIGTLSINNLNTVATTYGKDPTQAATIWLALDSVETGLGAGGGETIVNAIWFLLVSWTALKTEQFPKALNYLGLAIGVVGILSVVLSIVDLLSIFALGLIVWFIWLGIVMLRMGASNQTS